jgi:hypothetical protein
VDDVNRIIRLFGDHQKHDMRAEKRASMRSPLFDLPRRSLVGWECMYRSVVPFLRELEPAASPEEIGRGMRRAGSRPSTLQPYILMTGYLAARQQHRLTAGVGEGDQWAEERPDDLSYLVDWWARVMGAYRSDDVLLPGEAGGTLPILGDDDIAAVAAHLAPAPSDRYDAVQRMVATLELFSLMLHGEQRDGIFAHGPYALGDGSTLILKEFTDLRNDYLPWAAPAARNPHDVVVVAYAARDIRVRCDMYASMVVEPHDLVDRLAGIAVLTRDRDELRPLGDDGLAAVTGAAQAAQEEMFFDVAGWEPSRRVSYGAALFANHLKPFFDLAGASGDAGARILADFEQTAAEITPALVDAPVAEIWQHMATTEGDLYAPLATAPVP